MRENNDKSHGHLEQRTAAVNHDIQWLQEYHHGLKAIGQITSYVLKKGKETREVRYCISSLPFTAQELNDIARAHWGIRESASLEIGCCF